MAVGFGAVAELRLRLLWRRLRGKGGVAEGVALALAFVLVVPASLAFAALLGYAAWDGAKHGRLRHVERSVGLVFFGIWQAWTVLSLTMNERDTLDLKRVLVFPVKPFRVYLLGVVSSLLADPIAIGLCLPLAAGVGGAAVGRPGPWIVPLALVTLGFAAATVALVAFLGELLGRVASSRRGRELGMFLVSIIAVGGWFLGSLAGTREGRAVLLEPGLSSAAASLRWLAFPPAFATEAVTRLWRGDLRGGTLLALSLAAVAPVMAWAAYRLALASAMSGGEAGGAAAAEKGRGWKLPLLSDRTSALMEKELKYLLRHPVLRLSFVLVPGFAAFVAWKAAPAIPADAGEVVRALPIFGFAAYTHLVQQPFWLNAFGWERGGARQYFLSPLELRRVLAAKNASLYLASLATFCVTVAVYIAVGGRLPWWAVAGAFALHAGLAPLLYGVGNAVSTLHPQAAAYSLQRGGRLPALSGLLGMAATSAASGLFALPAFGAIWLDRSWVLPVAWAALGAALFAVYRATLPAAGRLVERKREELLAEVCGDDAA